jgi:hypothetical protein
VNTPAGALGLGTRVKPLSGSPCTVWLPTAPSDGINSESSLSFLINPEGKYLFVEKSKIARGQIFMDISNLYLYSLGICHKVIIWDLEMWLHSPFLSGQRLELLCFVILQISDISI